jgi:hypothetical protein
MTFATTYQTLSSSWARCGSGAGQTVENLKERTRKAREQAAKSKSGTWGPTHSFDSEEEIRDQKRSEAGWWQSIVPSKAGSEGVTTPGSPSALNRSAGTNSTKSSDSSPKVAAPPATDADTVLEQAPVQPTSWDAWPSCERDTTLNGTASAPRRGLLDFVDDICSPCHPRNLSQTSLNDNSIIIEPSLGIGRMEAPGSSTSQIAQSSDVLASGNTEQESSVTSESPAERRRRRHANRLSRGSSAISERSPSPHEDFEVTPTQVLSVPPKQNQEQQTVGNSTTSSALPKSAPLDTFTVDKTEAVELEQSISELTMRSSYGCATAKLSENRRMAYYAVGKHHRQSGRGGNRRCYFTGKLILSGAPFYAGSVQQGLRTLVVFCLPSSVGLPKGIVDAAKDSGSVLSLLEGPSVGRFSTAGPSKGGARSILSRKGSRIGGSSKMSCMDEMSLSVGEELDPNWGMDKDYLLRVLPAPNQELLDEMAMRFPEQFETLPVQVRSPHCWRLYVKFCFFSGLPIAEGELHYKVRDNVADAFGEEVILSHEVMEAVNGHDSAEIIRLPNLKTFGYLQKHYNQQSAKLPEEVFQRKAWEMIRPEV